MASEASRSGVSPDSYVGSLISLISKSEIRYEGVLFDINTAESSIGLRKVRSFGTEGRKKDGPQLPPSDKVYEYILFHGKDIKDLEVKSSPPVQTTAAIYNDPAIIQSHFPREAEPSTSLSYVNNRSQQDLRSYTLQAGFPKLTVESSLPLYQPSASLGSLGSLYPSPITIGSLPMPTYMQGVHGSSNGLQTQHQETTMGSLPMPMFMQGVHRSTDGLQTQQKSFLQPPPSFLAHPSVPQIMQYPAMHASLPITASNLPSAPLLDTLPSLLPSFGSSTRNSHSPLASFQSSTVPLELTLLSNKAPTQAICSAEINATSPQVVTTLSTFLDMNVLDSENPAGTSGSFPNKGLVPSLVTPNQFVQPGPTVISPSQSSIQSVQKDVEVVQVSSTVQPQRTFSEAQAPILPLPTPLDFMVRGDPSHSHDNNKGGHGRAKGHWASDSVTSFKEDFDFVAMNEKFNKDEVWVNLGKLNTYQEDGYSRDRGDVMSKFETKCVYVKDDFFDSLSSNNSGGTHNRRSKFSEQMKLNTEIFGNSARHQGHGFGRGSSGFDRIGRGFDTSSREIDRDGYSYSGGGHGFGHGEQFRGAQYGGQSYGYNGRGGWGRHAT